MREVDDIELRSEKVRNIIGQVPSLVIRTGIAVLFFVLTSLLTGAFFFKFDQFVAAKVTLNSHNDTVFYRIEIPQSKFKLVDKGQKVVISINNEKRFDSTILSVDTTLHVNKRHSYFLAHGILNQPAIRLDEPIDGNAKINVGETNLVEYVLGNN